VAKRSDLSAQVGDKIPDREEDEAVPAHERNAQRRQQDPRAPKHLERPMIDADGAAGNKPQVCVASIIWVPGAISPCHSGDHERDKYPDSATAAIYMI